MQLLPPMRVSMSGGPVVAFMETIIHPLILGKWSNWDTGRYESAKLISVKRNTEKNQNFDGILETAGLLTSSLG